MANLSITVANVLPQPGAIIRQVVLGEAFTGMQPAYLATDGKVYKTDSNGTTAQRVCDGAVLYAGAAGQMGFLQSSGPVNPGATLVSGMIYTTDGTTPGGIKPVTDSRTGEYPAVVGIATSTSTLFISISPPGGLVA